MLNNTLKIDERAFDRELAKCDAYGKSVIFCNFLTCQKLLKDTDQNHLFLYKGHKIYIDPNLSDFEYKIFPIINFEKLLQRSNNIYEYREEGMKYE